MPRYWLCLHKIFYEIHRLTLVLGPICEFACCLLISSSICLVFCYSKFTAIQIKHKIWFYRLWTLHLFGHMFQDVWFIVAKCATHRPHDAIHNEHWIQILCVFVFVNEQNDFNDYGSQIAENAMAIRLLDFQ